MIDLQNSTIAEQGFLEEYPFENVEAGIQPTIFFRITVPLAPFVQGSELVSTELIFEWIKTPLLLLKAGEAVNLALQDDEQVEGSIYLGHAHNPLDLKQFIITRTSESEFKIEGQIHIDFEFEGVGSSENFNFQTTIVLSETAPLALKTTKI